MVPRTHVATWSVSGGITETEEGRRGYFSVILCPPTICLGQGHMVVELLDTVNHCLLSENFFCLLDGAIAQTYFHRMQEFSNFLKLGLGVENFR